MGVHLRCAVIAHQKDQAPAELSRPEELLPKLTDDAVQTSKRAVDLRRVRTGLVGITIDRRELSKDEPRATCGGTEEVPGHGIIGGLMPHRQVRH